MEPNCHMTQVLKNECDKEYFEPVLPFHNMHESENYVVYFEHHDTIQNSNYFRIDKRPLRYLKETHKKAIICLISKGKRHVISLEDFLEKKVDRSKDTLTIMIKAQRHSSMKFLYIIT